MSDHTYFRVKPSSKVGKAIKKFFDDRHAIHLKRLDFTKAQGAQVFYCNSTHVNGLAFDLEKLGKVPKGWKSDRKNKHLERDGLKVFCPDTRTKEGKQLEQDLSALQYKMLMWFDSDLRKLIDPSYDGRELPIVQTGPAGRGGFPIGSMTPIILDDAVVLQVPHHYSDQSLAIDRKLLEKNGCTEMKMSEYLVLKARIAKRFE